MATKLIDTHTHVFPDKIAQRAADNVGNYYKLDMECDGTEGMLLKKAEPLDVEYFVISAAAMKPENVEHGNDSILDRAAKNPKFVPLCSVHPLAESAEKELERVKKAGAKGLKIHPDFQHFNIDDPKMIPIYRQAADLRLPILFHVGDENSDASSPTRLYKVLEKVPNLVAIAAHMGGYMAWDEAEQILYGTDVYMDTSDALLSLSPERVVGQIRKHGVDKILFGSDYPLRSTYTAFMAFDKLELTADEKKLIYLENAKKLYELK